MNNLMQYTPNYMNKLKIKRMEQKGRETRRRDPFRKFLNVDVELKDEDTLKDYEVYA